MKINKDTSVCISLAKTAGNFGTALHNTAFQVLNLNYIYKACSVYNLKEAVAGIRALGFRGAGVTMPYKQQVLDYVDIIDNSAQEVGAANTIVNNDGVLYAYNTDVYSTTKILESFAKDVPLCILGNGGFSAAVNYSAKKLKFQKITVINRQTWDKIKGVRSSTIFNCTPVKNVDSLVDKSNSFINCLTSTETGARMAILQATRQFKLYTGMDFPMHIIDENTWKLKTSKKGK